ncbi:MAG: hypothetical protein IKF90_07280 [Parasporobacterium sp.]|nr:hypothetical protein [Parasporobacterium sp.]
MIDNSAFFRPGETVCSNIRGFFDEIPGRITGTDQLLRRKRYLIQFDNERVISLVPQFIRRLNYKIGLLR